MVQWVVLRKHDWDCDEVAASENSKMLYSLAFYATLSWIPSISTTVFHWACSKHVLLSGFCVDCPLDASKRRAENLMICTHLQCFDPKCAYLYPIDR